MTPLDSSLVSIALPNIGHYFNVQLIQVQWVVISYLLVISSLLLTWGRLGDTIGQKRTYSAGLAIFTLGSLFCAVSPSLVLLIIFRGVQAIGAGMIMAMGPALITEYAPPRHLGRYLGIMAIAVSAALATGPVLGGFLTYFFGWPSIFLINIPIAAGSLIYAWKVIPATRPKPKQKFDILGSILLFVALSCIIFPISFVQRLGWNSAYIILPLAAGIISMAVFLFTQKRNSYSLIDLSLFSNPLFLTGNIALLLNYVVQYSIVFIMPFYLQDLLGLSPSIAGLLLITFPLTVMVAAPLSGLLSDRFNLRFLSSAGMIIIAVGSYCLSSLGQGSTRFEIIGGLALIGLGSGLFITPNNSDIMASVPADRRGISSSMIAAMRNMGMVFGVSAAGYLFTARQTYLTEFYRHYDLSISTIQALSFQGGLKITFLVACGLAIIAALSAFIRGRLK